MANFLLHLDDLSATLQRNIDRIIEISNIRKLAQSIEMGEAITCAETLLGPRGRVSHVTVVKSTCEQYRVVCTAPVDCNEQDVESTRAELLGQIAAQTLINEITESECIIAGKIMVFGDNKDSLVQHQLDNTKMSFHDLSG